MKTTYETPAAEVVKFEYKDQVVVASGTSGCYYEHVNENLPCTNPTPIRPSTMCPAN